MQLLGCQCDHIKITICARIEGMLIHEPLIATAADDLVWSSFEFNDPVNSVKVMSNRSVYLTTLSLGKLGLLMG